MTNHCVNMNRQGTNHGKADDFIHVHACTTIPKVNMRYRNEYPKQNRKYLTYTSLQLH